MLKQVKLLLNIEDCFSDDILNILIDLTECEIKSYCNVESLNASLTAAAIQMVVFKYNRMGTEGVASEAYNSASFSYLENYPTFIIDLLKKNRKIKTL